MIKKNRCLKLYLIFAAMLLAFTVNVSAEEPKMALSDLIDLALENNTSIRLAEANKNQTYWLEKEIRSRRLPVLSYRAATSYYKPDPSQPLPDIYKEDTSRIENRLLLTLPLYTGGEIEGLINRAELNLDSSKINIIKVKQQVQFETTRAYYDFLSAKNFKSLAQETVHRLEEHLKTVEGFYKAGTAAKIDILRIEVELADARQNLIKTESGVTLAEITLNSIIGIPLSTHLSVRDSLDDDSLDQTLEKYLYDAEKNRPELAQVKIKSEIAKKDVSIAKSSYLPSLSFNSAYSKNDDSFPGIDNTNWSVSLAAEWRLYDSGNTDARINQAKARVVEAQERIEQTEDSIVLEVSKSYLEVLESKKRIITGKKVLEKSEEDYRLALLKYKTGLVTSLDLLDYQIALTKSKTNYIQALYDRNISMARLRKNTGRPIK